MEAILELIVLVITFIFEVIFLLLELAIALILPSKRNSIKEKWHSSKRRRAKIITGTTILIVITAFILYLVLNSKGCSSQQKPDKASAIKTQTIDGNKTTIEIEISDKIKDKAVDYLREKWKNRKSE